MPNVAIALDDLLQKITALTKRMDNQYTATQEILKRLTVLEKAAQNAARKQ
jgi:hypothetical protein